MTTIIRTERLTKAYGSHRGIVDVDLEIVGGEVFGFLGPNGAGKTTTIRTLLDLIRPTSGRAFGGTGWPTRHAPRNRSQGSGGSVSRIVQTSRTSRGAALAGTWCR